MQAVEKELAGLQQAVEDLYESQKALLELEADLKVLYEKTARQSKLSDEAFPLMQTEMAKAKRVENLNRKIVGHVRKMQASFKKQDQMNRRILRSTKELETLMETAVKTNQELLALLKEAKELNE